MTEPVLGEVLASIGLLLCVWYFGFRRMRADDFRSDIRRMRDDLFDFMVANNLDFQSESYRCTRDFLNGLLRISNLLGPVVFLLFIREASKGETPSDSEPKAEEDPLATKLRQTRERAIERTVQFTFVRFTGFFVLVILAVLRFVPKAISPLVWLRLKTVSIIPEVASAGSEWPSEAWRRILPATAPR